MKDQLIDFWVNYALMTVIVIVLYWLIKRFEKRWWLYAWLLSIPFSMFLMFVQPVLIDPLYNDFYPLQNKELEGKILAIANEADIPAEHVYEVNMSEKTNALNAYVTGIGSNSRIVLWDTTLNRLSEEEILFIMAHEMGHYVMKHIYVGIAGYIFLSLFGLFIIHLLMNLMIKHYGSLLKINSIRELTAFPLLLILLGMLTFASSPLANTVARYQEKSADMYAIEMTNNHEAAISSFQELSKAGLSEVNPPVLVKIFRYTHPTMFERILYLEEHGETESGSE
jgi:Zn-dependent protease with chaperone function